MSGHRDDYAVSGEYIDLLIRPWWDAFGPAVAEALRGLPTGDAPLLDVGAGSGLGVACAVAELPGAEVLAVEPSPLLRAVLLARAAADPALRDRVTVLAADLLTARLPERVSGVLALNVIGHFAPDDRERVWADLAKRLAPGGRIVVNLAPPFTPTDVPKAPMGEARIGRNRYAGHAEARADGPDRITWHMTYEVRGEDGAAPPVEVAYPWWTLTPDALRDEAAAHGLEARPTGPAEAGLFALEAPAA
jgi:SAM-dependent methyltransferase